MKIVVLIDPEVYQEDDPQLEGKTEEVCLEMEFHVVESLRFLDYQVEVIVFDPNIEETIQRLKAAGPDLIFNLTEHVRGDRRNDMLVASLLDLLQLPYTGSGPMGLMLCRDKAMCKRLLSHHHVTVPDFVTLPLGRTKPKKKLAYPVLIKPMQEDGSDGISLASLVNNEGELEQRAANIHERMHQPVICEEYIDGREIYLSVMGNRQLRALPSRELKFSANGEGGPRFATAMVKQNDAYRKKWGISFTYANLPEELEKKAARISKRVYRLLQIRDYGRIDLRITPENKIVFLEANANPDLTLGDEMAESWMKGGKNYRSMIQHIVNLARQRMRNG